MVQVCIEQLMNGIQKELHILAIFVKYFQGPLKQETMNNVEKYVIKDGRLPTLLDRYNLLLMVITFGYVFFLSMSVDAL